MSKFKLSSIYLLSFLFLCFFLMGFFLINSSKKTEGQIKPSEIEKETMNKTTVIQAKKYHSKKTIITTDKEESFFCLVDQSLLSIILDKKTIETKELLTNLKGKFTFKELNQTMFFKGKEGSIDYKNLSLSIQNCLFYTQDKNTQTKNNTDEGNLFDSGMKSISISLKNLTSHLN